MLEIAFGKATITRNAQRVGFGKPAVSPQCSEYVTGVLHQPLPAHVHEFLAHYSPGTFYDKAIQEFGARVGLDASDLALRQFLVRLRNAKRQPALYHHPSAESAGA